MQIAAPFVQPIVSIGAVTPTTIALNKFGSVLVTITYTGNVSASGIDITLSPSTDDVAPVTGVILESLTLKGVRILPNRRQVFRLRFKVISTLQPRSYFPYVAVLLNGISAAVAGNTQFTVA